MLECAFCGLLNKNNDNHFQEQLYVGFITAVFVFFEDKRYSGEDELVSYLLLCCITVDDLLIVGP